MLETASIKLYQPYICHFSTERVQTLYRWFARQGKIQWFQTFSIKLNANKCKEAGRRLYCLSIPRINLNAEAKAAQRSKSWQRQMAAAIPNEGSMLLEENSAKKAINAYISWEPGMTQWKPAENLLFWEGLPSMTVFVLQNGRWFFFLKITLIEL